MSLSVLKGATDQSVEVRVIDSTDGTPEAAFAHDTAGIALWYRREGGDKTAITPASLAALTTAHADGGVKYISDGYVRIDVPDAAFATGATSVLIGGSADGMVIIAARVNLVSFNPQDSVRLGLTALPNAAADAAGGLPISDAGGLDLDAKIGALTYGTANRVNVQVYGMESGVVTAAAIANGAIDAATFAADVDAEILSYLVDDATRIDASALNTATGTTIPAILDDTDLIDDGTSGLAKIATDVAAILVDTAEIGAAGAGLTNINLPNQTMDIVGNITGNLSGSVGSVTGAVGSVTGAVGSVTGAVGSVTGNVGGNVTGSVGSVLGGIDTSAGTVKTLDAAIAALATAHGAGSWATATGFSTLDAAGVRTAVGLASANLDTQLGDLPTVAEFEARTLVAANYFDPAADTVANVTTVGSVTTKTGYKLAADGLDSISTTAPSGVASNFREMIVQGWRRWFKKSTLTATELKTYADNGTDVLTTQTVSDDGTTQTQGTAS